MELQIKFRTNNVRGIVLDSTFYQIFLLVGVKEQYFLIGGCEDWSAKDFLYLFVQTKYKHLIEANVADVEKFSKMGHIPNEFFFKTGPCDSWVDVRFCSFDLLNSDSITFYLEWEPKYDFVNEKIEEAVFEVNANILEYLREEIEEEEERLEEERLEEERLEEERLEEERLEEERLEAVLIASQQKSLEEAKSYREDDGEDKYDVYEFSDDGNVYLCESYKDGNVECVSVFKNNTFIVDIRNLSLPLPLPLPNENSEENLITENEFEKFILAHTT